MPTRRAKGSASLANSRCLERKPTPAALATPVMLPLGSAKLLTNPISTGSATAVMMIGIVRVACCAALTAGGADATITSTLSAIENQAAQVEDAMLRRLAKRRLTRIETDIRLLEKRLTEMIAAEADLARRYARLTSMPGVGPVLAFTLIALLPELGRMSRKQIAALVGLAPYDF